MQSAHKTTLSATNYTASPLRRIRAVPATMRDMTAVSAETVPEFPQPDLNVVSVKKPVLGRIVSNENCLRGKSASFVRHTVIDVGGTPLEGRCRVGQAFGVIPPGLADDGKPHKVRLYSLACPTAGENGDGKLISTTTKRVKPAKATRVSGV